MDLNVDAHRYSVSQLLSCLTSIPSKINGIYKNKYISKLSTPDEADSTSLIWISPTKTDKESLIAQSCAGVVVCDPSINTDLFPEKCFIVTENPKLAFLRIGNTFFISPITYGIHPTAIIHPEANIAKNVYVGPFVYIGKCNIEENTVIHAHCHLEDKTIIRKNVILHAGCKIGGPGLGHIFNEKGTLESFPQLGGVEIEDNVELGMNTIVLRAALSSTKIGKNVKIDCNTVIGHNVIIGNDTLIAANTVVGGSSRIGEKVFIGINVTVIDYILIGDNANLGANTTIIENIPADAKVIARPPIILSTPTP